MSSIVAKLFLERGKRIRSFLRFRLRSDDDAQDAVQDILLRLWERERNGTLKNDAGSYMVSAAYNAAVDLERKRAYRRPDENVDIENVEIVDGDPRPDEALFWRKALTHLTDALNELPELTTQVFMLSHVDGLTNAAIAERLQMSVRNVERHMAKALQHCEGRMKDYLK